MKNEIQDTRESSRRDDGLRNVRIREEIQSTKDVVRENKQIIKLAMVFPPIGVVTHG
jgi:hypothetical protein